jgi:hypothetical protein
LSSFFTLLSLFARREQRDRLVVCYDYRFVHVIAGRNRNKVSKAVFEPSHGIETYPLGKI